MGKGDKKTKKGKRFLGSYGVTRKQKVKDVTASPADKPKAAKPAKEKVVKEAAEEAPKAEAKPKAPKKAAASKKAAAKKKTEEE